MEPREIQTELCAIKARFPSSAHAVAAIYPEGEPQAVCQLTVYVDSSYRDALHAVGPTWADAFAKLHTIAAERTSKIYAARTRKLALAVIDLTQEKGAASDVDLRQRGFADAELKDLHAAACTLAGEMASGAPFTVTFSTGSNGAPATEAAE